MMAKLRFQMKTMNHTYTTTGLLIPLASIAALLSTGYTVGGGGGSSSSAFAQQTFPPPIFYQLRNILSYAITIPFSDL
jgi:hypothetical protein